MKYLTKIWSGW